MKGCDDPDVWQETSILGHGTGVTVSILLWVVTVPLTMLLLGALFQTIGSAIDRRRYPLPGRLVPVQGIRLHAYFEGEGEPTIILESGIAASSLNWRAVQAELAQFTRVVSYDRAGFGWSEAALTPRTIDNLVSELETMLDALEISGPLILVAHSFGSLIARTYCHRNPDRVVGLLLLDPIDCEHWRTLLPEANERLALGARLSGRGVWLARVGVVRFSLMLLSAGAKNATEVDRTYIKWQRRERYLARHGRGQQDAERTPACGACTLVAPAKF